MVTFELPIATLNVFINPSPHMPILGSCNSAASKDMMSKILTNEDTIFLIEWKTLWEKKKLLVMSNFFFSNNDFKSCLLWMRKNENLWSTGLTVYIKIRLHKHTVPI